MRPGFFFHHAAKSDWEILGLSLEDFKAMCDWAFGPRWGLWPQRALPKLWNANHKDLFTISSEDLITVTLVKIMDAWKDSRKKLDDKK